uniref:coiled-coil domain-containing protein 106-like n=1 Tax=Centroberyx gerrardi TaxID=166262 RepID=UPI003AADD341
MPGVLLSYGWSSSSSSSSRSSSTSSSSSSSSEEEIEEGEEKAKEDNRKDGEKSEESGNVHLDKEVNDKTQHPDQVLQRYNAILREYKRTKNLGAAYKAVGVDRNTVATTAPIAELAIVSPEKYRELLQIHRKEKKLLAIAKQCADVITKDAQLQAKVDDMKAKVKLLPITRRK